MPASKSPKRVFGIDIGGSGIKGAPVDVGSGALLADRVRIKTPQPSTPTAVTGVIADLIDTFEWKGPIGCAFPAVVQHGVVQSAANVDSSWVGSDAAKLIRKATGEKVHLVNDADAAGVAEIEHGAGRGVDGVVVMVTLGTGIGTAVFVDGVLVPNTEFGHITIDGKVAEKHAAAKVRRREDLSWSEWGKRVDTYLRRLEDLMWPDLFIVGGGVSKYHEQFFPELTCRTSVVAAELRNSAGIIGAASLAARRLF